MAEKKPRKKRSDFGTKRGKRRIKNPKLQTGSTNFTHIGTQQYFNPTLLAGLLASRAVVPQYLQPQQPQQPTELSNYAPRDLPRNVPPPQFRADTEQAQEEVSYVSEVRRAMGQKIGNLRKDEAKLFLRNKVAEISVMRTQEKNTQLLEQTEQLQNELQINSQKLIQQEGFLNKQKQDLVKGVNYMQAEGLKRAILEKGENPEEDLTDLRSQYLEIQGLKPSVDYTFKSREGVRGKASKQFDIIPIAKQDLQRGQEERPPQGAAELSPLEPVEPVEPVAIELKSQTKLSPRQRLAQAQEYGKTIEDSDEAQKKKKQMSDYTTEQLEEFIKKYKEKPEKKQTLSRIEAELLKRQQLSEFEEGIGLLIGK